MRRLICAGAIAAALGVAGCGEIANTITPRPGSANALTVALGGLPGPTEAGMYAAQAGGDFTATDLDVHLDTTAADPLAAVYDGTAQIGLASAPQVLQYRDSYHAVVAVAAILQTPQATKITCTAPKASAKDKHPASKCTATPGTSPPKQYAGAPSYPGLVVVTTKSMIVNRAPLIRRFVQALARGYVRLQSDPSAGTAALTAANSALHAAAVTTAVRLSIASYFPTQTRLPWGWLQATQWNALGTWMLRTHRISVTAATIDADDNELLAGQGI